MHSIWDTDLVITRMNMFSDQRSYTNFLIDEVSSGIYANSKNRWESIASLSSKSSSGNSLIALDYVQDAVKLNCESEVWVPYDDNPDQDFSSRYFDNASETVDLMLARGGYRMAMTLNKVFRTSCAKLRRRSM